MEQTSGEDVTPLPKTESFGLPRYLYPFQWLLLAFALLYTLEFLYITFSRIAYPFELEWLEGSIVDCVQRVLHRQSLYVAPSIDFTCYQYPPFYYYVAAGVCRVFGTGFLPLRLLSAACTLGVFLLIADLVRRETKSLCWGVISAGLYAATFPVSGAWFDLARVDSLFLFLLLAAVYAYRFLKFSRLKTVLVPVLFLLAFFTKQPAAMVIAALFPFALWTRWREALLLEGIFWGGALVGIFMLDYANGYWFSYYAFKMPIQHGIVPGFLTGFWKTDLWKPLPFALVIALLFLSIEQRNAKARGAFYLCFAVGMFMAAWTMRIHGGSFLNDLMPACCMLAILVGIAIPTWTTKACALRRWPRAIICLLLYSCCLLQFGWLIYNPFNHIPTAKDEESGRKFLAQLASLKGEVYLPSSGYYPTLAGKNTYAHACTVADVFRSSDAVLKDVLQKDLNEAFQTKKFSAVIVPWSMTGIWILLPLINSASMYGYRPLPKRLFDDNEAFYPKTGLRIRPDVILVPQ